MTRAANARIAGFTFLAYIAAGVGAMVVFRRAAGAGGVTATLAGLGAHPAAAGVLVLLGLAQGFSALVLAVTLCALTRDEDGDIARFGLVCRAAEGITAALAIPATPALLWLATVRGADAPDPAVVHGLAAYLLRADATLPATLFAAGSTAFAYLLLRGRMIPVALAWLGLAASLLLVIGLPLRLAGFLGGRMTLFLWLPMLAFEVPLALWFLIKGVPPPRPHANHSG